ncbi:MAG: hypothetical protein ACRC2R_09155 [Xenococcaceae cyanobacterium]
MNEELKALIVSKFGIERLREADREDKHFNSIPLEKWNSLGDLKDVLDRDLVKQTGQGWNDITTVCVLKEAAAQLIEQA